MAKGHEQNQERRQALSSFGKDLARRAKSKCELTQASGVPLEIYEIPPHPKEPEFDRCLLLSESVIRQLAKPSTIRPEEWRHLTELIWTDVAPVQVMAVRILRHLAPREPWAQNLLDEAYFDPEVEAMADEGAL